MAETLTPANVLFAVMGAPHASDQTTTLLRLAGALLGRGGTVQVWTCGYATALTQAGLGDTKPRNIVDWSGDYPSTAAMVRALLDGYPERLCWYSCRFCSAERGVTAHIPEIRVRPPGRFAEHVALADKTIFLGVI